MLNIAVNGTKIQVKLYENSAAAVKAWKPSCSRSFSTLKELQNLPAFKLYSLGPSLLFSYFMK